MSEPIRYTIASRDESKHLETPLVVSKDGELVQWKDYDKLKKDFYQASDERWDYVKDVAKLKAEVERLKTVSTIEQRTIQGLQKIPEWSEISRLTAYCRELEAENNRLRASSFVTSVPVEQYERLRKAGDAMAMELEPSLKWNPNSDDIRYQVRLWNAAKEGKPSV